MTVTCALCNRSYDDARCWTICPHMPLEFGSKPFHPTENPHGYCRDHDLAGPHFHPLNQ